MMHSRPLWLCLAAAALGFSASARSEPSLRVAEVAWTTSVADRSYVDHLTATVDANTRPYFWTRLEGNSAALETMRREGRLPIQHRWIHWIGGRWPDSTREVPTEEWEAKLLAVGQIEIPERLAIEIESRQYFDWRTWSRRQTLTPGLWEVEVVDNDGMPLPCKGRDLCRIMIEVKE